MYFLNRVNEKKTKVYITNFKKVSHYTTQEKLRELEDLGFEELHKLFLEKCAFYGNSKGYVSQWLFIPEMMHVLASLYYDKPNTHPLNVKEMREHWDATKAKKRAPKRKEPVDMYIDDD